MVIWTGYGFLAGLIPLGVFMLTALLVGKDNYPGLPMVVAAVVAAGLVWWVGRRLNTAAGRELIDPKTGERLVLRRRHSMFWIPIEWWSIACLLIAAIGIASLFGRTP